MPSPAPPHILRRIRNRIIDALALASSFDAQRAYQTNVPIARVAAEVLVGWEDWVDDPASPEFAPPVFSAAERAAMVAFHQTWSDVCNETPDPLPPLDEVQRLPAWERLRGAAEVALRVFEARGRTAEDQA